MTDSKTPSPSDEALLYRSVHTGAVLGMVLSIISVVMVFTAGSSFETTLLLVPVPLLGLAVSLAAWRAIAGASDMYTGQPMAMIGAGLSAIFLSIGLGYGGYVYATEVPDGYVRTSFLELKPNESDMVNREPVPPKVVSFIKNEDKIFIKGFIRPDSIRFKQNISDFMLVRDNQECCFGDMSKV